MLDSLVRPPSNGGATVGAASDVCSSDVWASEGSATAAAGALVLGAVSESLARHERVVLAVSGGRDSMVLLHAAARAPSRRVLLVATFDHGTGPAALSAAKLVARHAQALGLQVQTGRSPPGLVTEAAWRAARWRFLNEVADGRGALVATAHTLDDQLETVLMRILRGSGTRGLSSLLAHGGPLRPLVEISRGDIAACAQEWNVQWQDDPSNASRRHLRNRVRLDLLPALTAVRPGLPAELLSISRRAAELREEIESVISRAIRVRRELTTGAVTVARDDLLGYDAQALALLWPALAARAGAALDRRGTERICSFTIHGRPGMSIQLSGGYELVRHRGSFVLRRVGSDGASETATPLADGTRSGAWRFVRGGSSTTRDLWSARFPADQALSVRAWRPGDRMTPWGSPARRRVKGLLRDAGIDGIARKGWPVVFAGNEIVWIPGVRRASAAAVRSGRPVLHVRCERISR